jgi:hypothetical protein
VIDEQHRRPVRQVVGDRPDGVAGVARSSAVPGWMEPRRTVVTAGAGVPVTASTARASTRSGSGSSGSSARGASTSWAPPPPGPSRKAAATPTGWVGPWKIGGTGSSAMLSRTGPTACCAR